MNIDSPLGERIIEIVHKEAGGRDKLLAKKAGFSASVVTAFRKNPDKDVNASTLQKILLAYPNLSSDWLLTGHGGMYKNERASGQQLSEVNEETVKYVTLPKNIKYIPHPVTAGYNSGFADSDGEAKQIYIPGFEDKKGCVAFPVSKDSMLPLISSGDILVCRKLESADEIRYGEVYVIVNSDGPIVKRLMKGKDDDYLSLHSDNKIYDPYPVRKDEIQSIYFVLGFISQNTSPRITVTHLTKQI